MKKLFLTICVIALAASTASAQFAVSAGFLNRDQKTTINKETKSVGLNGFYAGVSYTLGLPGGFAITPGVYYNNTSDKTVDSSDYAHLGALVDTEGTQKDQYLSVPVDISWGVGINNIGKVFVFAGPVFEYALGSDFELSVDSVSKTYDRFKENEDYKKFNLLVGGGIGVEILETLRVVAGYNYGIADTYDDDTRTVKTNQLYAGLSYLF